MDMLDQYLTAVGAQLPREASDDIVAELRDTLLTRFEEREAELGRSLDDGERETILRSAGHPLAVAARYRSGPQVLVGRELFPYWLFGVKAALAILAAICAIDLVVRVITGSTDVAHAMSQAVGAFAGAALGLIGSLTCLAAACEHFGIRPRYLDSWRVEDLAVLRLGDPANWAAPVAGLAGTPRRNWFRRRPRERALSEGLGSLVADVVFVLWWLGVLHFPETISLGHGAAAATLVPGHIWTTLYLAILLYALAQAGVDALAVIRPGAARLRAAAQAPVAFAGLAITWVIFRADTWFTLVGADGSRAVVRGGASLFSAGAWTGLVRSGQPLSVLAGDVAVVFAWTLAAVAIGLGFKTLSTLWAAVRGTAERRATP